HLADGLHIVASDSAPWARAGSPPRRSPARGAFSGALTLLTRLYTDPLLAHKPDSFRAAVTYNIAACHHQLGELDAAISYYQEVMGLPAAPSDQRGNAAENLRRARLGLI